MTFEQRATQAVRAAFEAWEASGMPLTTGREDIYYRLIDACTAALRVTVEEELARWFCEVHEPDDNDRARQAHWKCPCCVAVKAYDDGFTQGLEAMRQQIATWCARRCEYAPSCGRCAYCRVATVVRELPVQSP